METDEATPTVEEIRHERVNKIVDHNMSQGICITCGIHIRGDEVMIDSQHGKYHGPPKNCVEGRD